MAGALTALGLERLQVRDALGGRGDDVQGSAPVSQQQPGGGDVQQSCAVIHEPVQQLGDVAALDQAAGHQDERCDDLVLAGCHVSRRRSPSYQSSADTISCRFRIR